MKTVIISYSATGNNDALATSIANDLDIDHIKITKPINKITFGIILTHLFNRVPKVEPMPNMIDKYDFIILCAPVWMGKVAAPLRPYLSYLKKNPHKYAFVSLCGGAAGPNTKLSYEITKRVGEKPTVFTEYYLSNLFPKEQKPVIKDTMDYIVNEDEIKKITNIVIKNLKTEIK